MLTRTVLIAAVAACFFARASFALDLNNVIDDEYLYESDSRSAIDRLEDWRNMMTSPDEEVAPGDWSYGAIKELAEKGFLPGYDPAMFDGEKTFTRREMAGFVSIIFDNYLAWRKSGKISKIQKIFTLDESADADIADEQEPLTAGAIIPESDEAEEAPEAALYEEVPEIVEQPQIPFFAGGNKEVEVESPDGAKLSMTKKMPRSMMIAATKQEKPAAKPSAKEAEKSAAAEEKTEESEDAAAKKDARKKKISDDNQGPDWVERTVKVDEEVVLEQKLMERIDDLANKYKKELQDLNKAIGKDVKEVEKISNKNQKQIAKLTEEDERFKITGTNDFSYSIGGQYGLPPNSGLYGEATGMSNLLSLTFTSKPNPAEDLTLSATTKAKTQMGTRTGYFGYIDGTNTAFNIYDLQMKYTNPGGKSPKNFRLKNLNMGNNAISFSPLTIFGNKVQGISASLLLNDFGLNVFAGRTSYHYPIFLGKMTYIKPGDSTQYDRYVYGFNIQSPIFGEASSMGNLQKIFLYDNDKTNYYSLLLGDALKCNPGYWLPLRAKYDPSGGVGESSDESYRDMFCLPPEKNSVTSLFVRYPIIKSLNLTMTGEYAHSTYYKPGYGATFDPKYLPPSVMESYDKDGIDLTEYGYEECDTTDLSKNVGSGSGCWIQSKERRDQDDGFLLLFDFAKGPVKVFPLGYAKLGSQFVTKNMSLPGLDISSLMGGGGDEDGGGGGGGLGFLPISLQSLEIFITSVTLDMLDTHKYKYSAYYIWGGETKPMYFDPGAVLVGMSSQENKGGTMEILARFLDKLNSRRETLKLNAWINSGKYNLTDRINFDIGYTAVNASLAPACLDGDPVTYKDDMGNLVYVGTGNGQYTCGQADTNDSTAALKVKFTTQKFAMFWKTSKNSDLTTTYSTSNINFKLSYPDLPAVEKIVSDLVPTGRTITLSHAYNYKLTSSTSLNLSIQNVYDTVDDDYRAGEGANDKYPVRDNREVKLKVTTTF